MAIGLKRLNTLALLPNGYGKGSLNTLNKNLI
jgi:hypothetical protein